MFLRGPGLLTTHPNTTPPTTCSSSSSPRHRSTRTLHRTTSTTSTSPAHRPASAPCGPATAVSSTSTTHSPPLARNVGSSLPAATTRMTTRGQRSSTMIYIMNKIRQKHLWTKRGIYYQSIALSLSLRWTDTIHLLTIWCILHMQCNFLLICCF